VGSEIEIRVTGVRPGEKLAEELYAPDEEAHGTSHPAIVRLQPVPSTVTRCWRARDGCCVWRPNAARGGRLYLMDLAAA